MWEYQRKLLCWVITKLDESYAVKMGVIGLKMVAVIIGN